MPLNGSVKTEVICHQLLSKFPEAVKATPASLECVTARVCLPSCLWHVMLEQDCCILLGATGELGTGDLFLLICPAQ